LDSTTPIATEQRASGSSFYTAMRLLPRDQRVAMFAIYDFCRKVDDIADSLAPREERLAQLDAWRADIGTLYAGRATPLTAALAPVVGAFDLAQQDFIAVVDGMAMDVTGDICAPDLATLDLYCDRVASAVGRLSVRVFGMERNSGIALAHHLGRALQLTNILRDLDEDAGMGRLYLPGEVLRAAGITATEPMRVLENPALGGACGRIVELARDHFRQAEKIMSGSPRRVVRAPRIMGEVYRAILDALVARGWAAPRAPVRVTRGVLAWIILRYAII
jgi:phytoene synthase